jgi:tRNA modification GTPase
VLVVLDQSEAMTDDDRHVLDATRERPRLIVKNKSDCRTVVTLSDRAEPVVAVSAQSGAGMAALREAIVRALTASEPLRDTPAITNVRHTSLLEEARTALARAGRQLKPPRRKSSSPPILQQARERLDEIVGKRTSDDVLRHIFERFCIGK